MKNLYVNKIEIGSYDEYDINLPQEIKVNSNIVVYQLCYHLREYANFFVLYVYEDSEAMVSDLYIIDSQKISNDNLLEYHAIKIDEDIEWHDLIVRLIQESKKN